MSSGDSGFAGCDLGGARQATGSGVSGLCTPLEAVCVGGTLFDEAGSASLYWQSTPDAANGRTALSYIPEVAWNESGTVPFGVTTALPGRFALSSGDSGGVWLAAREPLSYIGR